MDRGPRLSWSVPRLLPVVAVLVPLACSPLFADSFELPKLVVLKLGLVVVLLALATGAGLDSALLRAPAALAVLLFLGLNGLATLGSIEPRTSFLGNYLHDQGLLTLAVLVAYFFLAASWIRTEAALARLVAGFALAATATGLYAVAQYVGFDPLGWPASAEDGRRTYGTLGHPNQLGEFLAMITPLSAWLAWRERGSRRGLLLAGLAVQLVALLLSGARVAWLVVLLQGLVGGLVMLGLRRPAGRRLGPLLVLVPLAAALAVFLAALFLPGSASPVDEASRNLTDRGQPLKTRQYVWHSALAMIADRPLLGWGPDTFQLVYPAYRSTELDRHEASVQRSDAAHNVLLGIAVSAGLLGLAGYLVAQMAILGLLMGGVWGSAAAASRGQRVAALALLLAWTGYLILFTSGQPRLATDWLAWLVGGAALGLVAPGPGSPWRFVGPARLAPLVLGLGLLAETGSALGAEVALARALEHHRQGAPREAVAWLERAVQLRPFEPAYHRQLGRRLGSLARQTGDPALFRAASDHFEQASTLLGGREPYVWSELANALLEWETATGRHTDAPLDAAERAIELDPRNPLLYAQAAELAFRLGQPDLAREYWEAGRARARSPDALEQLGEVAELRGDLAAASSTYREAAEREWRFLFKAALYRTWGNTALNVGHPDEAAVAFGRALELAPDDVTARLKLAEALAAGGRREEALAEVRRVLADAPANPGAAALVQELSRP